MRWLSSKNRKVHQRAMNRLVRGLNKNIEEDNLWQGRFYARQIESVFSEYEDGSGAALYARLRFFDKVTGITYDTQWDSVNHWRFGATLFWEMNDFIVNQVRVWEEEAYKP